MATLSHNSVAHFVALDRLGDRFATLRQEIAHRLAQRREVKQVYSELSAMTDAELNDIGLSRSAIREIAREAGRMV